MFCDFVKIDGKWWKSETVTNVNLARMAKKSTMKLFLNDPKQREIFF